MSPLSTSASALAMTRALPNLSEWPLSRISIPEGWELRPVVADPAQFGVYLNAIRNLPAGVQTVVAGCDYARGE